MESNNDKEESGGVEIATINPMMMADMINDPAIAEVAKVADEKLRAALSAVF